MTNPGKYVRQAFYDELVGNHGYVDKPVYKEDVPASEDGFHVLVRLESRSDGNSKDCFEGMHAVITEAIGVFVNAIDPDPVEDLQDKVMTVLKQSPDYVLSLQGDYQMVTLKPQNVNNVSEDDGTKRYYRIITRWECQVVQLTT